MSGVMECDCCGNDDQTKFFPDLRIAGSGRAYSRVITKTKDTVCVIGWKCKVCGLTKMISPTEPGEQ